jgi:hypothetical protein
MDSPEQKTPRLASKCPHVDKPEKARGMCQSCYRAAKKAEELESGAVSLDDESGADKKTGRGVEKDLASDPNAVRRFYEIMWSWLEDSQKSDEPIIVEEKGKKKRDFKLEARLRESTDQRAMKAAQVLGRAYIVERTSQDKPQSIQIDGIGDIVQGWMGVSSMKKGSKEEDV